MDGNALDIKLNSSPAMVKEEKIHIIILQKILVLLLLLFMFIITACGEKQDWSADKRFKPYLEPGAVAHDFLARTSDNKFIPFSTYSGNPILLSFFKKNCTPCVTTLKMLDKVHRKYKDKGLVSIAVNVDNLNYVPSSTVLSHVKNMGLSYTVLLDDQAQAMEIFKVINIPVTFFINDKGIISYISYGEEDLLSPENRSRIEEITKQ